VAIAVALGCAGILLFLARLVVKVHLSAVTTGEAGMVGLVGRAFSDVGADEGRVRVSGEIWRATSTVLIPRGGVVRVVKARNLDLEVEPVEGSSRVNRS